LAVGDTISSTSASASISFQPAAGVGVMITFVSGFNGTQAGLTDGTNESKCYATRENSGVRTTTNSWGWGYGYSQNTNVRIPITNTYYLTITNTSNAGYSGVQII